MCNKNHNITEIRYKYLTKDKTILEIFFLTYFALLHYVKKVGLNCINSHILNKMNHNCILLGISINHNLDNIFTLFRGLYYYTYLNKATLEFISISQPQPLPSTFRPYFSLS